MHGCNVGGSDVDVSLNKELMLCAAPRSPNFRFGTQLCKGAWLQEVSGRGARLRRRSSVPLRPVNVRPHSVYHVACLFCLCLLAFASRSSVSLKAGEVRLTCHIRSANSSRNTVSERKTHRVLINTSSSCLIRKHARLSTHNYACQHSNHSALS
jgi:hypothetical protein